MTRILLSSKGTGLFDENKEPLGDESYVSVTAENKNFKTVLLIDEEIRTALVTSSSTT